MWHHFKTKNEDDIIKTPWPVYDKNKIDKEAEQTMAVLQEVITSVRSIRSRMGVPPAKKAELVIRMKDGLLEENYEYIIQFMGGISSIKTGAKIPKPPHSATAVVKGMELFIPLKGLIDINLEKERLKKRKQELTRHYESVQRTLKNKKFLEKAPQPVVENEKEKLEEMNLELEKLTSNLEMLN